MDTSALLKTGALAGGFAVEDKHSISARLIQENYPIVFRYLIKLTLSKNLAEELTQETMIKALEKFKLYDANKAKFSTWLIAIAQNSYIDYLRKNKRYSSYVDIETLRVDLAEGNTEQKMEWRNILDALARLSDEVRVPIVMKHYYGYSYEEIAQVMNLPIGTVKSRVHNGLIQLRKELA